MATTTSPTPTASYSPIRPVDLQDPLLFNLNKTLQNMSAQLAGVGAAVNPSGGSTANVWQTWAPNIITTMTYRITSSLESSYLLQANMVFVNLDIQLELSGTATNNITFSPPANILPFTNSGNAMAAFSFAGTSPVPVYARTQAQGVNNGIIVIPFVGQFALGLVEIVLSGWYRI